MENGDDVDDPFTSAIMPHCRPTSSQEEKLRLIPFSGFEEVVAGDTQSSSASDEASDRATEMMMVSLPDSADDYETPPEHHSYSQNSSNDGQVAWTTTVTGDRKLEGVAGDGVVVSGENDGEELRSTVGLANDLGFSERSPAALVVDDDDDTDTLDNTADQIEAEDGFGEIETENVNGDAEVVVGEPTDLLDNAHEVFVEMPTREQEVSVNTGKHIKNIGDIDKFRYVGTKSKRDLPSSLKDQKKRSEGNSNYSRHKDFIGVLDHALKLMVGNSRDGGRENENEKEDDCDFLETAKRRGMTFPRPRWWPPEGFQD